MNIGNFTEVWKCEVCQCYNSRSLSKCGFCDTAPRQHKLRNDGSKERAIHDHICTTLKQIGWPYFHSRLDKPTTNQLGCPDFIIAAPCGKTIWIECKTPNAKQTIEQEATQMVLEKQGHDYYLIRSIQEFADVIKNYFNS